ncbi:hypothetical protein B6R96_36305 (plasmid) [Streptomyces sp. Sge12]|uniref:hypothetical protein n=1 Tax=Streptomyces sp. Sge12 TaxID=1972846 RepID=UPI0009C29ED2|nr:hypothetical protein [Streptomyces sp. Sge12]ARE79482.1 hypothetical protein B6R96_36305 [Streptomyces sp. Sge12]
MSYMPAKDRDATALPSAVSFLGTRLFPKTAGAYIDVDRSFLVLGTGSSPVRRHGKTTTSPALGISLIVQLHTCPTGRSWLTTVASPIAELSGIDGAGRALADLIARPVSRTSSFYIQVVADTLLVFGLRSRFANAPEARAEAREAVAAALQARRAILESVDDMDWRPTVAAFSSRYLGIGRADWQWLEAVSTALLGNWTSVLDTQPPDSDDTLHHLRQEARTVHRQLMPLGQRKAGPGRVWMLDYRFQSGETLHELVGGSYRIDDEALAWYPDRHDACAVFGRLRKDEQHVARAFALGGGSWAEAAAAAGLPAQAGERVMRKLRRLGLQHQQRWATLVHAA